MRVDTGRLRVVPPDADPIIDGLDDGHELDGLDGAALSPGAYIHKQRQRQGLSLEQLAAATKIPRRSLELLEDDRYGELPGPVFVKGFLRCAARALGVSPDAVMELLYERERALLQARRQRPTTGGHATASAPSGVVAPKLPPRIKNPPAAESTTTSRLRMALPGPHSLLWILVAMFVGFLVLTAFNLIGGGTGPTT
jgi:transcriptional regulator with XRE-family HTH domain